MSEKTNRLLRKARIWKGAKNAMPSWKISTALYQQCRDVIEKRKGSEA